MDLNSQETIKKIQSIFTPYYAEKRKDLESSGNRFVHYTSADNAIKILTYKQLWMRSPRCMNDYMEIFHGYEQLVKFFNNSENKNKFVSTLNTYNKDLAHKILTGFDQLLRKIQNNTYIASVSVHLKAEDSHGRLSMWRAYGNQSAKAALILNNPPESNVNLKLLLFPAAYFTDDELEQELLNIIKNIERESTFLKTIDIDYFYRMLVASLIILCVCLKHPGFSEEQEWRIIYMPDLTGHNEFIERSIESISGVPQLIFKLPLENNEKLNITGLKISDLIDKVIIGPTQYPNPIQNAFIHTLKKSGVGDAESKVTLSAIPLRT